MKNKGTNSKLWRDIRKDRVLYIMLLPVIINFLIYRYLPMFGLSIAFQNYNIFKGVLKSEWVGLDVFREVVQNKHFWYAVRNTFVLNIGCLIFSFPAPIIAAILINEMAQPKLKRLIQSIIYIPHFISWVVIASIMVLLLSETGVVNHIIQLLGGNSVSFLSKEVPWIIVYIVSDVWKTFGWGTIIYLGAITSIDPGLYEAASIDGANRFQQIVRITLPSLKPTIILLLIINTSQIASIGFEKPFMLGNSLVRDVSDVISTHVYNYGVINTRYSYSTAVGLFQSVINLILIVSANTLSRRLTEESIW